MANIVSRKRMAAEILKCGITRIKVKPGKEVEDALTRDDIRNLIRKGIITKIRKKGSSRAAARKTLRQKKKGRRKGMGSRKGSSGARTSGRREWMKSVKMMRSLIRNLRDSGMIGKGDYRKLYLRVKGGMFRNRKHIMLYIREHELLKGGKKIMKPKKAVRKKPGRKPPKKTKTDLKRMTKPKQQKLKEKKTRGDRPSLIKRMRKGVKEPQVKKTRDKGLNKK